MKKFWSWFIPFILIICIVIYMLIIKVNSRTLTFGNILDEPKLLMNIDGRNVYSIFDVNLYNKKEIKDLDKAEFNNIINLMTFIDGLDDGGTKIYYSNKIANKKFYIIACHTLMDNNDIYILNDEKVEYCQND